MRSRTRSRHGQKALQIQPKNAEHAQQPRRCPARRPAGSPRPWPSGGKRSACIPTRSATQISLAWILSTAPDAGVRDGIRALELAQRAYQTSGGSQPDDLPRARGRLCGKRSIPGSDPRRAGRRAASGSQGQSPIAQPCRVISRSTSKVSRCAIRPTAAAPAGPRSRPRVSICYSGGIFRSCNPMRSMTGYGRGESERGGAKISVEDQFGESQTERHRDQSSARAERARAARPAGGERSARPRAHQRGRGSTIASAQASRKLALDRALARSYHEGMRALQKELGVPGEITIGMILQAPGVMRFSEDGLEPNEVWPALEEALGQRARRADQDAGAGRKTSREGSDSPLQGPPPGTQGSRQEASCGRRKISRHPARTDQQGRASTFSLTTIACSRRSLSLPIAPMSPRS